MDIFKLFNEKFNKNDNSIPASISQINELEETYQIYLPKDHKIFLLQYGDIWTPDILDIIVDNDLELNDVQEFWSPNAIIEDKKSGFTSMQKDDLIGFASDCVGNVFAFKKIELKSPKQQATVYLFDHDLGTCGIESRSFTTFIERYLHRLLPFL